MNKPNKSKRQIFRSSVLALSLAIGISACGGDNSGNAQLTEKSKTYEKEAKKNVKKDLITVHGKEYQKEEDGSVIIDGIIYSEDGTARKVFYVAPNDTEDKLEYACLGPRLEISAWSHYDVQPNGITAILDDPACVGDGKISPGELTELPEQTGN